MTQDEAINAALCEEALKDVIEYIKELEQRNKALSIQNGFYKGPRAYLNNPSELVDVLNTARTDLKFYKDRTKELESDRKFYKDKMKEQRRVYEIRMEALIKQRNALQTIVDKFQNILSGE